MRLIDADALIFDGLTDNICQAQAEDVVAGAPTIEPKRGRWIKVYGDHIHIGLRPWATACSECGLVSRETNFCPNCGADMRGEQDG